MSNQTDPYRESKRRQRDTKQPHKENDHQERQNKKRPQRDTKQLHTQLVIVKQAQINTIKERKIDQRQTPIIQKRCIRMTKTHKTTTKTLTTTARRPPNASKEAPNNIKKELFCVSFSLRVLVLFRRVEGPFTCPCPGANVQSVPELTSKI